MSKKGRRQTMNKLKKMHKIKNLLPRHRHVLQKLDNCVRHVLKSTKVNTLVVSELFARHVAMVCNDFSDVLWWQIFLLRFHKPFACKKRPRKRRYQTFVCQHSVLFATAAICGLCVVSLTMKTVKPNLFLAAPLPMVECRGFAGAYPKELHALV